MKKLILYFTFFLLIWLTFPLPVTAQIVNIPDPNLRAVIENALGKVSSATITTADMATLTELTARNANISDLTGLEHATHLIRLELVGNNISVVSVLANLTNLESLFLDNNRISDIPPLAGLTKLTRLGLGGNNISDISTLADLTDLTWLRLGDNYISDISPLASLTRLTWMDFTLNNISDISPLVENTGMGSGDQVLLNDNPLNSSSIKTHIPTLQGREVTVEFENTANLNFGEPRIVRLVYFLPSDRAPQQDINIKMDTLIKDVQQFYADQMESHGFDRKTFMFEADENGKVVVYHVNGQFTDSYYHQGTFGKVSKEIAEKFDMPQHIYFVAVDISSELIDLQSCGEANRFWDRGGREFIIPASGHCFNLGLTAHEIGHAFGLDHDFRNDTYIMSYGSNRIRLSKCAAEWLDAHRFFNSSQTSFNESAQINKRTVIQMLPPLAYSSKTIRLRFEVTDTDGLHQAQLIIPTTVTDPVEGSGIKLHGCKSLRGENSSLEFITSELTVEPTTEVILQVIDVYGGITRSRFTFTKDDILPDPTNRIPTKLEKISGDNQQGLSGTPLPNPLVVKVTDQNGIALEEVIVAFTVTAGDGTLSITRTTTDANGRAQSILTLGPNLGTQTVSTSAAGIEGTVTFNAMAREGVFSPDSKLRTAIGITLNKPFGEPIVLSDMETLMSLKAEGAGISDLTGLEFATNLTELSLGDNSIWDISVVAELIQLTELSLWSNNISDISAVAGLTNLTWLDLGGNSILDISPVIGLTNLTGLDLRVNLISDISAMAGLTQLAELRLQGNNISDISAVAGLTNLIRLRLGNNRISDISPLVANTGLGSGDTVDVRGTPLSYVSIHTHIPILQSRGVTVEFDNQTHSALLKISGDNQKGASFASLSQPFVVEAQDANGSALTGISITFAITAGGGTLNTTITRTDTNGRAQSTLTLGPNLGTNTVQVSATGIEVPVTFHAVSDTEAPSITADVNNDGSVNVLDLILITSNLDTKGTNLAADVNGDGIVNILDLVLAAGMFDGVAAAPPAQPQVPETLTALEVQGWLTDARALEVKDPIMKRGFLVLEQLLASLTPKETELLPNYPNPFNPETWIPYRLAEDAVVTLTIYDTAGQVVRTLEVGHRIASAYENRSKAIHWDGRNEVGERVASGVYFYTLAAGEYSATRRMLIIK